MRVLGSLQPTRPSPEHLNHTYTCYIIKGQTDLNFREGNGNPLQYSHVENLMGGGSW